MIREGERRDLYVIVADQDMLETMTSLLSRPESLAIRRISYAVDKHLQRDAGCRTDAARRLRPFIGDYRYALVVFDKHGCGRDDDSREDIRNEVETDLSVNGWRDRSTAIVTVNESNVVHAFRLTPGTGPLFTTIKNDERARIKETPVDAEALLPDGPYDLWREDDEARRVKDLAGAFARYPRLPKVLNQKILLDTVLQGVERGLFVARLARPDGTFRTWWREAVDSESCTDPALELILPEMAELSRLADDLLVPVALPELWTADLEPKVALREVMDYFRGGHTVQIPMEGYDGVRTIPRCGEEVIREAVERAVMRGTVWLTNGPASVWRDPIPYGVFDENAVLYPKPELLGAQELVEEALPGAWRGGTANGIALAQALSQARGRTLPWGLVRESIRAGVESRWLEVAEDSGTVSCGYDDAGNLRLARPAPDGKPPPSPPEPVGGGAEAALWQSAKDRRLSL